jgi:hypothetical protein
MLDNSVGSVYLYPGAFYRGMIESKYYVPSLEALEQRVAVLPHGTQLLNSPYKRDRVGRPIIFSTGEFDQFERFCHDHDIELIIH